MAFGSGSSNVIFFYMGMIKPGRGVDDAHVRPPCRERWLNPRCVAAVHRRPGFGSVVTKDARCRRGSPSPPAPDSCLVTAKRAFPTRAFAKRLADLLPQKLSRKSQGPDPAIGGSGFCAMALAGVVGVKGETRVLIDHSSAHGRWPVAASHSDVHPADGNKFAIVTKYA